MNLISTLLWLIGIINLIGTIAIGIPQIINGKSLILPLLTLLVGIAACISGYKLRKSIRKPTIGIAIFGIIYILLGSIFILALPLFSIFYLISGIGVIFLKPFGRYLAIITHSLAFIFGIVIDVKLFKVIAKNSSGSLFINTLPLSIALVAFCSFHLGGIYFFTRAKVKEQFKKIQCK